MKSKDVLNDYIITQADKRNESAKEHLNHNLTKVGIDKHEKNKVPYLKTRTQKYLCEDCKVMFDTYNTTEDDKIKKGYLKDTSYEE